MRAAGPRSCRSRPLPGRVLQGKIPGGEDRLRGPDAEWTGEACRGGQRPARWRADRDGREAEGSRAREPGAAAGRRDPAQGRDPRAVASGCAIGPSPAGGGPGTMVARVSCGGGARPPVEDMIACVRCPAGHGRRQCPERGRSSRGVAGGGAIGPSPPATGRADLQGAADRPLRLSRSSGMRADPARLSDRAGRDVGPKPGIGRASDAGFRVHGVREIWRHPPVTSLRDALPGNGQVGPVSAGPREPSAPRTGPGHAPGRRRQARRDVGGLRLRRIRDRCPCPCPTHRRPARRSHRPCRVRSRCPGTGRPPAPSGKGGWPRASLRQGCPISCDTRHRAPRTSRHRALGRSGAFAAPPGPRSPSPSGTLVTPRWPRRSTGRPRQRLCAVAVPGAASTPSNGCTGSTIAACRSPPETSRPPRRKRPSRPPWNGRTRTRDQEQSASARPGAVQNISNCCSRQFLVASTRSSRIEPWERHWSERQCEGYRFRRAAPQSQYNIFLAKAVRHGPRGKSDRAPADQAQPSVDQWPGRKG